MPIDLFANNASATVSSGGTTAPAAGTVESWTLASIVRLAASSSAAAPTQMRLVDPAAPSEVMLLTNLSGTAGTVTRGVEGTTPVTHSAGFTVNAVASGGALSQLRPFDLQGFAAWAHDPILCNASLTANGSRVYAVRMPWPETALATYLHTNVTLAEVGTGGVNALLIYDSAGNLLGQAGGSASTIFSVTGFLRAAIASGPISIPGDPQGIILGLLQNAGTTNPKFAAYDNSGADTANIWASGATKIRKGVQASSSQFTVPSTISMDGFTPSDVPWMAVS
jgi:hypothetical protein